MAMLAKSSGLIPGTESETSAAALPWYGKLLATGVLALAPLVSAYAEEPAKPDAPTSCITLTKEDEAYLKKFEDKVNAAKIEEPAPLVGSLAAGYEAAGIAARTKKSYVEAAAYFKKSIQLNPASTGCYEFIASVYMSMGTEERDPKAKNAYFKESIKYGEQALAILDKKAATSGVDLSVNTRAKISQQMGRYLYELNERKSALKYLEDAKRLSPERFNNLSERYLAELQRDAQK